MKMLKGVALVFSLIAIGVVGAMAVIWLLPTPPPIAVRGTITLGGSGTNLSGLFEGDYCRGQSGYADLSEATLAAFYDQNKSTLGSAALSAGHLDAYGNCVFTFAVNNISRQNVYSFRVGARPAQKYTYEQLKAKKFALDLKYGEQSANKLPSKQDSLAGVSKSKKYQVQDTSQSTSIEQQ